jgi:hypothetical protein
MLAKRLLSIFSTVGVFMSHLCIKPKVRTLVLIEDLLDQGKFS